MSELDEIRKRDAEFHYCATCGQRVYRLDDPDSPHNITVEQCEAYLSRSSKRERIDGRLCWNPEDHHPFVEGEIPDYEQEARDRRYLLGLVR